MGTDMLRTISRRFRALRSGWRRLGRDDSGAAVAFVVMLPVLAGIVAVGVEAGKLYNVQRQMQNAADDAALAGSIDRLNGLPGTQIQSDALYEAQRNGFTDGTNGVTVSVAAPPTSGAYASTAGAVQVTISSSQSFVLGSVLNRWLGRSTSAFTISASSVAGQNSSTSTTTNNGCLVALTPLAEQGIRFTSFNNFTSDCALISNGTASTNDSNASIYMASFNSATITNPTSTNAVIWTRGSFYATGYNKLTVNGKMTAQTMTVSDPTSTLPTPSPGTCTFTNYKPSNASSVTLNPGTYCGGLTISSINNVYFMPGTYYIANGDLYITSVNNVSCPTCTQSGNAMPGVTFVLTQTTGNNDNIGGVKITSENNVTLNAPNQAASQASPGAYPYPGVLFYQDRNAPAGTMSSTSKIFTLSSLNNATLSGAIYFPQNRIDISSLNNANTSTTGCTVWVGRYIKFSSYNNNYVSGCSTYSTRPVGITTTVAKAALLQ
jgi:Flp pilus assembly protein TadG